MREFCKFLAVIILTVSGVTVAGCKPDEPIHGGNNGHIVVPIATHEFVDLGLPSGILWAACNVGADSPEDFGDYFAWGETAPKELYDWKNYRYGTLSHGYFAMTKYCSDSCCGLDGFVDNLTVLEAADDAVVANWGARWRMPTREEWEELFKESTNSWTTQNGVEGRLFVGPNGNSVFFPATGFRLGAELLCPGLGAYWSSTLHGDFPERGWSLHFDMDNCHVCGTYERNRGQSIRAVRACQ